MLVIPSTTKIEFPDSREKAVKVLRGMGLEMATIHACRDDRNTIGIDLKAKIKTLVNCAFVIIFGKGNVLNYCIGPLYL